MRLTARIDAATQLLRQIRREYAPAAFANRFGAEDMVLTDPIANEWDTDNRLHKFNPLADWSLMDVWKYIRMRDVPYNELHDLNYPSIGCAPCTRALAPGEDLRAGRWWWENPETRECGLHRNLTPDDRPQKTVAK